MKHPCKTMCGRNNNDGDKLWRCVKKEESWGMERLGRVAVSRSVLLTCYRTHLSGLCILSLSISFNS